MSKLGIKISIDVTKIDKARLYKGKKGMYLNLTTFIDVETPDQFDNHGFISQETTKEEREAGYQTPILGNCKVFYNSEAVAPHRQGVQNVQQAVQAHSQAPQQTPNRGSGSFDSDDIPWV